MHLKIRHENCYHQVIVTAICYHIDKALQGNSSNRHQMARESKQALLFVEHDCQTCGYC
jgi:hypothetical protein